MKKAPYCCIASCVALIAVFLWGCTEEKKTDAPAVRNTGAQSTVGRVMEPNDSLPTMSQGNEKTDDDAIKPGEAGLQNAAIPLDVIMGIFSNNFPIYKPATLITSHMSSMARSAMATLSTKDGMDSVIRFYRDAFKGEGWTLTGEVAIEGASLLNAARDTISLNVAIKKRPDYTQITLTINEED